MSKYRRERINDAVAEELAIALRDIRDPRIVDNFVSITGAVVAPDLRNARIYFSAMGDKKEAEAALRNASGLFRRHLATTLNLRLTPELTFTADRFIEHGAHIAKLISEIQAQRSDTSEEQANESPDA